MITKSFKTTPKKGLIYSLLLATTILGAVVTQPNISTASLSVPEANSPVGDSQEPTETVGTPATETPTPQNNPSNNGSIIATTDPIPSQSNPSTPSPEVEDEPAQPEEQVAPVDNNVNVISCSDSKGKRVACH